MGCVCVYKQQQLKKKWIWEAAGGIWKSEREGWNWCKHGTYKMLKKLKDLNKNSQNCRVNINMI